MVAMIHTLVNEGFEITRRKMEGNISTFDNRIADGCRNVPEKSCDAGGMNLRTSERKNKQDK